jgi:Ser-tRNA(Ala) deacylase AlaX
MTVAYKFLAVVTTGVASHMGKIDNSVAPSSVSSWIGERVKVSVDADRRQILSECHTAGHVVDMAMAHCEMMMPPTKAYHFLDGPYVEYKGKISAEDRGPLLEKLQKSFQELVETDIATEISNVPRSEAEAICNKMAGGEDHFKLRDTFGEDETVRIVRVAGWPCPCGGTHVKSTGELKGRNWGITGFRCKKGTVRVKYGQDWNKTKDDK